MGDRDVGDVDVRGSAGQTRGPLGTGMAVGVGLQDPTSGWERRLSGVLRAMRAARVLSCRHCGLGVAPKSCRADISVESGPALPVTLQRCLRSSIAMGCGATPGQELYSCCWRLWLHPARVNTMAGLTSNGGARRAARHISLNVTTRYVM